MEQAKKYALVTGASRGIGRAVSLKLCDMGYSLLLNYQSNEEAAGETLQMIQERGGDGELLRFDVSEEKEVENVLGQWLKENEEVPVEVLVNNAGIRSDNLMMWMEKESWDKVLKVSLDGFYNLTTALLRKMMSQKYGRIVNVVSLSGIHGMAGQANYSAAKSGVIGATKSLAQEVGRRKITVNAVAPGFIKTDMTEDIDEKQYKSMIPVGRFGEAKEVADLVGFLASPEASYITGEVISVNGGLYT